MCGITFNDPLPKSNSPFPPQYQWQISISGTKICDPGDKPLAVQTVKLDIPDNVKVGEEVQLKVKGELNGAKNHYIWEVTDSWGRVREHTGTKVKVAFCETGKSKVELRVVDKTSGRLIGKGDKALTVGVAKDPGKFDYILDQEFNLIPIWPRFRPGLLCGPWGCELRFDLIQPIMERLNKNEVK